MMKSFGIIVAQTLIHVENRRVTVTMMMSVLVISSVEKGTALLLLILTPTAAMIQLKVINNFMIQQ